MANQSNAWGGVGQGFNEAWNTGTQGLNPDYLSGGVDRGSWGSFGNNVNYQQTADKYNQTYTDPTTGEVYKRSFNSFGNQAPSASAQWTDASGRLVNNLASTLQNRKQVASGADFSGYQSGLNNALSEQQNYANRYKQLLDDPSKIQQTAGYQFALDQGNQAINRSAAAKGMLNSGNVLAELAKYGQGMASQNYQQQLGNIQQGAGLAGTQVNTLGNLMQNAQNFGIASGYYPGSTQIAQNAQMNRSMPVTASTSLNYLPRTVENKGDTFNTPYFNNYYSNV